MRFGALIICLILAMGLGGTVVALHDHEENTEFVSRQQTVVPVKPGAVERLVLSTDDPRPGYDGRARSARCAGAGRGALGNPWSCQVRYPRAPDVRYRLTVYADRSIYGTGQPEGHGLGGVLTVRGCCVAAGP
jgi:hypothetical protein